MNRNAEALKSCEEAYAGDSANLTIMTSLADAYAKNTKCSEGAKIVSRISKLFPHSADPNEFKCPRASAN